MKMPGKIENKMFAPCGINCTVCYKCCNSKNPCNGCYSDNKAKPEHCHKCKIKTCVTEKGYVYCYECSEFPCKLNKNLERSYKRYNWSLIMNGTNAREVGVKAFLESDREYWTCSRCGGVISLHDAQCSDCHTKLADMRLGPYAHFGIIDRFEKQKDYASSDEGISFEDCLKKYRCIAVPDDIINDWWDSLMAMKSYYHCFDRPEMALARWGVTLIPPESLEKFADIIKTQTCERFSVLCRVELDALLDLLEEGKQEKKFIIHYGV